MKQEINGWVIHQQLSGSNQIWAYTFSEKRADAIETFMEGMDNNWEWWKDKQGCKCVRAKRTIEI